MSAGTLAAETYRACSIKRAGEPVPILTHSFLKFLQEHAVTAKFDGNRVLQKTLGSEHGNTSTMSRGWYGTPARTFDVGKFRKNF
jgi:hypothetical protein